MKFDLADVIKDYIKDRDYSVKDSEYLIIGQRGALRRDEINTMLERLTKEIGMVNKLKPHPFRHAFCTRLINRGVPISTVSKLAGHRSVDTTATFYINTEVLTWLIGEENISNIPLNELNKGFSRVCIYNKTANISNEKA